MRGRDWVLVMLGALFLCVFLGLAIATADMEPCWPDCKEAGR